jgi:hypothetical protein
MGQGGTAGIQRYDLGISHQISRNSYKYYSLSLYIYIYIYVSCVDEGLGGWLALGNEWRRGRKLMGEMW